jgi:hypothetical protein
MSGKKSSKSLRIGGVHVRVVGSFRVKTLFETDPDFSSLLVEGYEKKLDKLIKRNVNKIRESGKYKDKYFRLQMGRDTTMFHGSKEYDDYTTALPDLIKRFFNTLQGSDLGERLKKFPPIKILAFSNKEKTSKHADAVSKKGIKVRRKNLEKYLKAGVERKRKWRINKRINDKRMARIRSLAAKKGWQTRRANKQVSS